MSATDLSNAFHREVGDQILSCSICFERYENEGYRRPKMLHCQHTFCLNCLADWATRSVGNCIECPVDRKVTQLSEAGTEGLENNLVVMQMLDMYKESVGTLCAISASEVFSLDNFHAAAHSCHICGNSLSDGCKSWGCSECQGFLCEECKVVHDRGIKYRSHTLIAIQYPSAPIAKASIVEAGVDSSEKKPAAAYQTQAHLEQLVQDIIGDRLRAAARQHMELMAQEQLIRGLVDMGFDFQDVVDAITVRHYTREGDVVGYCMDAATRREHAQEHQPLHLGPVALKQAAISREPTDDDQLLEKVFTGYDPFFAEWLPLISELRGMGFPVVDILEAVIIRHISTLELVTDFCLQKASQSPRRAACTVQMLRKHLQDRLAAEEKTPSDPVADAMIAAASASTALANITDKKIYRWKNWYIKHNVASELVHAWRADVSQSSGEFRALEAVKGSNGWARYCVGPEQRVIFGGRSGEPEHIDQLGSQQYWSDESVLSPTQVSAVECPTLHDFGRVLAHFTRTWNTYGEAVYISTEGDFACLVKGSDCQMLYDDGSIRVTAASVVKARGTLITATTPPLSADGRYLAVVAPNMQINVQHAEIFGK